MTRRILISNLLYNDDLVVTAANADLFGMLKAGLVFGIGVVVLEMVVEVMIATLKIVAELAVGQRLIAQAGINTGLIHRQRIEGSEHTHVGKDGCVVLAVAVAVGGDVADEGDVEIGSAVNNSLGVLGNTAAQLGRGIVVSELDGVKVAGTDAAAAANAIVLIDVHLFGLRVKFKTIVGTHLLAELAAAAHALGDNGLAVVVLIHLAGSGAAAHTDVLESTAEARILMTLEMAEAYENIGVHDCTADLGSLENLTTVDGDFHIISALKAVTDNNGAADSVGSEAVEPGTFKMLNSILAGAHIESVAVAKIGYAARFLDDFNDGTGIVGTQEAEITQLTKMHLDDNKAAFHVNIKNTGLLDKSLELGDETIAKTGSEISEVNFGFSHYISS